MVENNIDKQCKKTNPVHSENIRYLNKICLFIEGACQVPGEKPWKTVFNSCVCDRIDNEQWDCDMAPGMATCRINAHVVAVTE